MTISEQILMNLHQVFVPVEESPDGGGEGLPTRGSFGLDSSKAAVASAEWVFSDSRELQRHRFPTKAPARATHLSLHFCVFTQRSGEASPVIMRLH